jgi:hypothetical protein
MLRTHEQSTLKSRGRKLIVAGILWAVIVVLFALWLLGFLLHVGGGLIHLLLVLAVIMVIVNVVTGRGVRV